jgi:hypothetical protein
LLTERGRSFLLYQINDIVTLVNPTKNITLEFTVSGMEEFMGTDGSGGISPMVNFGCSRGSNDSNLEQLIVNFQKRY